MKRSAAHQALLTGALALPLLAGCASDDPKAPVKIANPASEYCLKLDGRLVLVRDAEGARGMCHLPDGTVIEEWELFRRDHP